jgi:hypothetical protein
MAREELTRSLANFSKGHEIRQGRVQRGCLGGTPTAGNAGKRYRIHLLPREIAERKLDLRGDTS